MRDDPYFNPATVSQEDRMVVNDDAPIEEKKPDYLIVVVLFALMLALLALAIMIGIAL